MVLAIACAIFYGTFICPFGVLGRQKPIRIRRFHGQGGIKSQMRSRGDSRVE